MGMSHALLIPLLNSRLSALWDEDGLWTWEDGTVRLWEA